MYLHVYAVCSLCCHHGHSESEVMATSSRHWENVVKLQEATIGGSGGAFVAYKSHL